MIGDVFSALNSAVGAADKVMELMNRRPQISPSGTLVPPHFEGRIDLNNVWFAYPSRPDIQVGSTLAWITYGLLACPSV